MASRVWGRKTPSSLRVSALLQRRLSSNTLLPLTRAGDGVAITAKAWFSAGMRSKRRIFEYRGFWLGRRSESPHWQVFWRTPASRRVHRRSTGTTNLEAAKEALLTFAGGHPQPRVQEPVWLRLDQAMTFYLEHVKDSASYPTSKAGADLLLEFARHNGIEYASQFTMDRQRHYIKHRKREIKAKGFTASNGTVNRELVVLRAAFNFAEKCGRTIDTPHVQLLPEPPPRDEPLTARDCRRLLAACDKPHLRLFVLMALHTLQRTSSLLSLRVEQVDLMRSRINFHPPGKPRTVKLRPVVPITRTLWPELARAVRESQSGYVIEFDGKPVKSVRTAFRTAAKKARLKGVAPVDLRHSGATLLAAAGVPLRQIAGMLGHSHLRTTERYAKHRPDYLHQAAETLDELF